MGSITWIPNTGHRMIEDVQKARKAEHDAAVHTYGDALDKVEKDLDINNADGAIATLAEKHKKANEDGAKEVSAAQESKKAALAEITEVQNEIETTKETTAKAQADALREAEGIASAQADFEFQSNEDLQKIRGQQTDARQLISDTEKDCASQMKALKDEIHQVEEAHATVMAKMRSDIQGSQTVQKDLNEQIRQEKVKQADSDKAAEEAKEAIQVILTAKQEKQDILLAEKRENAAIQKKKLELFKELPAILMECEEYDKKMKEADEYRRSKEANVAELQRQSYLSASKQKEELYFLTKEYERVADANKRLKNRLDYGLRNPYS